MSAKKVKKNSHATPRSQRRSWRQQVIYAGKNVIEHFKQNAFSLFLTIFVIAISIALPTICYVMWKNSQHAAEKWYPTPNLTVYISKSFNDEQTKTLIEQIKKESIVGETHFLSKDEALKEFLSWSGYSESANLLDDNPLPAVFIIHPEANSVTPETLKSLQQKIKTFNGVDDVKLDNSWFSRLTKLTSMIAKSVIGLAIIMILAIFLTINNSIKLTITARYETIKVMQLIGATEGFILRPFLYKGALMGFLSALLALIISQLFFWQLNPIIQDTLSSFGATFSLLNLRWEEMLLIILISVIISWFSAWLTTKKTLKQLYLN